LPQRRTAIKDRRKNKKQRFHNLAIKTDLKKTIKKFLASIASKNLPEAEANLHLLNKKIDKAAKRAIFHKNTASRRKSRFGRLLAEMKKSPA
jgi:small subunit ribosomal protein S20